MLIHLHKKSKPHFLLQHKFIDKILKGKVNILSRTNNSIIQSNCLPLQFRRLSIQNCFIHIVPAPSTQGSFQPPTFIHFSALARQMTTKSDFTSSDADHVRLHNTRSINYPTNNPSSGIQIEQLLF
jgi:hypothetical protein